MNNTVKRSLSGLLLIGLVLAGLLLDKYLFALLFGLLTWGMLAEFYRMTLGTWFPRTREFAAATGAVLFLLAFLVFARIVPWRFIYLCLVLPMALMISTLYVKDKEEYHVFANLYTGLFYIAIPMMFTNLVVFDAEGNFSGRLMVCFFCLIWASDVGAYCFGLLLGKNGKKLFPSVSPHKSWAGFWGGLALALLTAFILAKTGLLAFPLVHCLILAVLMNVAGVFGDLFESQWKRIYNLKDSGHLIPGHGGLLDRFDSTLFAVPAGAVYLILTGLI